MIYAFISYQIYVDGRGPVEHGTVTSAFGGSLKQHLLVLAEYVSDRRGDTITPDDIQIMSLTLLTKEQYDQLVGDSK